MEKMFIDETKTKLSNLQGIIGAFYETNELKKSRSKVDQMRTTQDENRKIQHNHIEFDYNNSGNVLHVNFFTKMLVDNIRLRQQYGQMSNVICYNTIPENKAILSTLVPSLAAQLEKERVLERLQRIINQDQDTKETRLAEVDQAIVDSQHSMNRTVERVIKILLKIGAENYDGRTIESYYTAIESVVISPEFRSRTSIAKKIVSFCPYCCIHSKEILFVNTHPMMICRNCNEKNYRTVDTMMSMIDVS